MDRSISSAGSPRKADDGFLVALRVRKTAGPWVHVRGVGFVAERVEASTERRNVAPNTFWNGSIPRRPSDRRGLAGGSRHESESGLCRAAQSTHVVRPACVSGARGTWSLVRILAL